MMSTSREREREGAKARTFEEEVLIPLERITALPYDVPRSIDGSTCRVLAQPSRNQPAKGLVDPGGVAGLGVRRQARERGRPVGDVERGVVFEARGRGRGVGWSGRRGRGARARRGAREGSGRDRVRCQGRESAGAQQGLSRDPHRRRVRASRSAFECDRPIQLESRSDAFASDAHPPLVWAEPCHS